MSRTILVNVFVFAWAAASIAVSPWSGGLSILFAFVFLVATVATGRK